MYRFPSYHRRILFYLTILTAGLAGLPVADVRAQSEQRFFLQPYEFGFRAGSSISRGDDFTQFELFTTMATPWGWMDEKRRFAARLDFQATAGVLRNPDNTAGIFSFGPAVRLTPPPYPFYLTLGFAPTYLTQRRFGDVDFGQRLQFTSSATATWMITPEVGLRYHIQHMSNARMASPNPGLNIHSAGVVIAF